MIKNAVLLKNTYSKRKWPLQLWSYFHSYPFLYLNIHLSVAQPVWLVSGFRHPPTAFAWTQQTELHKWPFPRPHAHLARGGECHGSWWLYRWRFYRHPRICVLLMTVIKKMRLDLLLNCYRDCIDDVFNKKKKKKIGVESDWTFSQLLC